MLFEQMDGLTLSVFATAFSISLAKGLTKDEVALLSLFLSAVSSTLALIEGTIPVLEDTDSESDTTEAEQRDEENNEEDSCEEEDKEKTGKAESEDGGNCGTPKNDAEKAEENSKSNRLKEPDKNIKKGNKNDPPG